MLQKKEYFIYLPDNSDHIQRVRVKMMKYQLRNKNKKEVLSFSVGYEIEIKDKWKTIVRFCNYHEEDKKEFHVHNKYLLSSVGKQKRIFKHNNKKIPASQMRWSIRNIKSNYLKYKKDFLAKLVYN